ncbi:MAG: hypothetical protein WD270_01360 [Acetobacterales bacterium]
MALAQRSALSVNDMARATIAHLDRAVAGFMDSFVTAVRVGRSVEGAYNRGLLTRELLEDLMREKR